MNEENIEKSEILDEENEEFDEVLPAIEEKPRKISAREMFSALQQSESAMSDGVSVYRFTSQRMDNAAPKKFLGFYEMTGNLEQDVKDNHGGGVFFLQLRENGQIATTARLTISGKPINEEETTPDDTNGDKPSESVVLPAFGGLSQFDQMLNTMAKMQKMFNLNTPPPPPPKEDDFEDKLDKLASFQAKIQNLAPPQTGTTGWDLIGKFVDKVPDILANASTLVPLIGQQTSNVSGIIQTPNGNVTTPANNPTNQPPANNSPMNLFSILIGQLIELIQTNDDVQAGVALCQKFYADYPLARPILDGFLNLNPTLLMTMLKANPATRELAALPQAAVYLADLFRMYKEQKEKGEV